MKVFVTYSWDDTNHNELVIAFTNFLRKNGFEANIDLSLNSDTTA